jgi:hypothetical protein
LAQLLFLDVFLPVGSDASNSSLSWFYVSEVWRFQAAGYIVGEKEREQLSEGEKRMGIGSPRLRSKLGACALPLFAAAGLIGAPAAYGGGVGPVDATAPVAPASTASSAPASAVTDPVAATIVAPSVTNTADNAAQPAVSTVGHAADTGMRAVTNTRTQARATVRQLAQLHPAPQSPPAAPPPFTSRSKEIPGVFRHAHTTHASAAQRRGVQSLPGSWTPGWRSAVSGSRSTGTPTGSRHSALPKLAPFTPADWLSGLNSGGSASSASSAGGLLLLAIVVFALTCVPADAGRRVLLFVRALRPSPPLLRLERPD